jgi:xylulokinase
VSLLGVDLGTGSVKVVLTDSQGQVRFETSRPCTVEAPAPGWAEASPAEWLAACVDAIEEGVRGAGAGHVEAVGFSGQMHGLVLCDDAGRPVRPAITWADRRATEELELYRALPPETLVTLANPLVPGMAGPLLLWLARHEPDGYERARWALQPKDWLRLQLTGEAATEPSDASATLLYDLVRDEWATDAVGQLGLDRRLLPETVASAARVGTIRSGSAAGAAAVAGAADTAAALLGAGLRLPGDAFLNVGTGAQIAVLTPEPLVGASIGTHAYRAALPASWYAMAAVQNAGLALEWVLRTLAASWEEVYRDALPRTRPGADGLIFLPHLSGERTPLLDPDATGAWLGLRLEHGRPHLLRAALEGVALAIRHALETLVGLGVELGELRLAGGGARATAWRQLLADVLARPLEPLPSLASSARGAALLAAAGTGMLEVEDIAPVGGEHGGRVEPDPVRSKAYDAAFDAYVEAHRSRAER